MIDLRHLPQFSSQSMPTNPNQSNPKQFSAHLQRLWSAAAGRHLWQGSHQPWMQHCQGAGGALLAPQLQRIFFHICFDGIPWYCMVLLAIVWYCMVWALACCWYSELPRIFCYIRILHPWHQPGRPLRGRVRGVPGHQRVHLLWYCDCTKPRCHTSAISNCLQVQDHTGEPPHLRTSATAAV